MEYSVDIYPNPKSFSTLHSGFEFLFLSSCTVGMNGVHWTEAKIVTHRNPK